MSPEKPKNVTSIDKHLYDETPSEERLRRLKRTGIGLAGVALASLAVMGLEKDNSQEAGERAEYTKSVIATAEHGGGTFVENGKEITVSQAGTDVVVKTEDLRTEPVRGDEVDNLVDQDTFDSETVVLHNPVVVPDAKNSANVAFIGAQDAEGDWYWTGAQELEDKDPTTYQIYTDGNVNADDAILETVQ